MLVPATGISSQISDAVYLASILILAVLLARPVYGVYSASQTRAVEIVAAGVEKMIDSIPSGGSTVVRLEAGVGATFSVRLSGHTVSVSSGGFTAISQVKCSLPSMTLSSGTAYRLSETGGRLFVEKTRSG